MTNTRNNQPQLWQCLETWRQQSPDFVARVAAGMPMPVALRYLALQLWQEGRLADAIGILRHVVMLAPGQAQPMAELASLLVATDRNVEALNYLASSLQLNPNQPAAWLTVATICVAAGDLSSAENAFRTTLELDPSSVEAITGLGLLHIRLVRFSEAVAHLEAAVNRGVNAPSVYACLGEAHFHTGDFKRALGPLRKAVEALPEEGAIARKFALAALVVTAIEYTVEDALRAYQAAAGQHAQNVESVLRTSFQVLCGYGYREAGIRVGAALIERFPGDAVIGYQLDALRGRAKGPAPSDVIAAGFDRYAETFEDHLTGVLGYDLPAQAYAVLADTGISYSRLLDLGCGTGLAGSSLHALGGFLIGVDVSQKMLEKAAVRGNYDRLVQGDAIQYLSDNDEYFDLVVALDLAGYIGPLAPLFAAVASRLTPGGLFIVSIESAACEECELRPSGRFVHNPDAMMALATRRFSVITKLSTTLRHEANNPVSGTLALFRLRP